ncbi:IAA-amino acid hydrolase ILR1-like 1-like protein [Drosera capensis]
MTLDAAKILQEYRDELKGTVLVFQPGEEGLALGTSEYQSRLCLGRVGFFEAVIAGKGGHAAIPHHSVDPILAASNVIVSLQHILSPEADPLDSQVVTVAKFQGGKAFNVIPDSPTIGGTFRAFVRESLYKLRQRIEEVIVSQAAVQRCNTTVNFLNSETPVTPPTINNEDLHDDFTKVAAHMLGPQNVKEMAPLMGSEDLAFYQELIPGYLFFLGLKNDTLGQTAPEHNPKYTVNEEACP